MYNLNNTNNVRGKSGAGFTIIEIIAAIALLLFGILLLYNAFFAIIKATSNTSVRYTASYLGQEGLQIIRNIRDKNFIAKVTWSTGLTGAPCAPPTGCQADYTARGSSDLQSYNSAFLAINSDGLYGYGAGSASPFQRKITISPVAGTSDALKVDVLITWTYNAQPFSYDVYEYLYNWDTAH